jgi:hypothetical protein
VALRSTALSTLLVILLSRGGPQWVLYRQALPDRRHRLRFVLLVSQSLNLPIAVGYLEVQAGLMSPQVEATLVGGSLLSVLLLPSLALAFRRQAAVLGTISIQDVFGSQLDVFES